MAIGNKFRLFAGVHYSYLCLNRSDGGQEMSVTGNGQKQIFPAGAMAETHVETVLVAPVLPPYSRDGTNSDTPGFPSNHQPVSYNMTTYRFQDPSVFAT